MIWNVSFPLQCLLQLYERSKNSVIQDSKLSLPCMYSLSSLLSICCSATGVTSDLHHHNDRTLMLISAHVLLETKPAPLLV